MAADHDQTTESRVCECCGEPATTQDIDGVPLCDADYAHLLRHWRENWEMEQNDEQ